jgi:hypothetical protein
MRDIAKRKFDDLFIRQPDDYSCGAACLATVARIYDLQDKDYPFFRELLAPCPDTGVDNPVMENFAKEMLPYAASGEGVYDGGIAIANILHAESREGHYVVFLAEKEGKIAYYDPYDHEIFIEEKEKIEWVSGCGQHKNWAINFEPLEGNSFDVWESLKETAAATPAKTSTLSPRKTPTAT